MLGGGTWLMSKPQPEISRLVDLTAMGWTALTADFTGLHIAGTCTIAALAAFVMPLEWTAGGLVGLCCRSLGGSFKVWNAATVGGNICLALPVGPMIALASALDGIATIWCPDGSDKQLAVADLVIGDGRTALADGEILRDVLLPDRSLRQRYAFRHIGLSRMGRSSVMLIGTLDSTAGFALNFTAATSRPIHLCFDAIPSAATLATRIDKEVSNRSLWLNNSYGSAVWRHHVSLLFAEEIRRELEMPEHASQR
jgi:CO/xanthine dehydrogenase FAD-binding subunit